MILAVLLSACTSTEDVEPIRAALSGGVFSADTGGADTGHEYDSGIPDVEGDTSEPDLPDTGVVYDPPVDTAAASTGDDEIPGRYLLEAAYHVMQLNGAEMVDVNKVLEGEVQFLSLAQEDCAASTPTYDDMVWLEYEDCPFATGWGWVIDYSSCDAPGGAMYAGQLAFTFPLFAELDEAANPVDFESAQEMTLDRGTDSSAIFYYSVDLGGPTMSACGRRSGHPLRPTVTGTMALEEEGSVSMTGTIEASNIIAKAGRAWTVTRTATLDVTAENADGESFEGRIEMDGVRHRVDAGYPDRGFVRYDDPSREETGQVMFSSDTAIGGTASYSTIDTEPIETSFEGLH